ncbi:MAG: hypothetical protein INH43_23005 [Acidobacteriaceae bacterium]|jgi:hypothetical protein|nr:hypothetical protein [Acidobacteriaceae bacterium]
MILNIELPPPVEQSYREEALARGVEINDLLSEVLISNQPPDAKAGESGLGLFSSPEDAALMDEVVAIARELRRQPSRRV